MKCNGLADWLPAINPTSYLHDLLLKNMSTMNGDLLLALLDKQPNIVVYYTPVFSSPDSTRIVDFNLDYCNEEAANGMYTPRSELLNQKVLSLTGADEDTRRLLFSELSTVYKTGNPTESSYFNAKLQKYFKVKRAKIGDGVLAVVEDITKEVKERQEKERQTELSNLILNNALNGWFTCEVIRGPENRVADFLITRVNPRFTEIVGLQAKEVEGHSYLSLFPSSKEQGTFDLNCKVFATGKSERRQMRYEGDGLKAWYDVSVSKLGDNAILVTFADITENKEAQLKQESLLQELKRSNDSLEEFARAASHDLQEPLRKIDVFVEKVANSIQEKLSEEEKDMVRRIQKATSRMTLLIDDLLEYSFSTQDKSTMASVDLNEKLKIILSDLELVIKEKKAVINVSTLPVIYGHRRQLQQLFQNLITNSLKYSSPNETPVIEITSKEILAKDAEITLPNSALLQKFYRIQVKDNGIGFEQKYAEKIFDVFARLHGKTEYQGTGIGLSIAKKVVENHNGFIYAKSERGKGAVFTVLLPLPQ